VRLRRAAAALLLLVAGLATTGGAGNTPAGAAPGRSTVYSSDAPDPHVIRVGNRYYAYSTNRVGPGGWLLHVPVLVSTDLATWGGLVDAFPKFPRWARPGTTWAPTVTRDGQGYTLFYTARHRASGRQCIGRARASSPTGPFRDRSRHPFICQLTQGGSIDPYVFRNRNGVRYLYWKNDGNCCGLRVSLWGQRIDRRERLIGRAHRLLSYTQAWERPLIENPAMTRSPDRGGEFRLFYAANWWASRNYATGFARCRRPLGPCVKVTRRGPWHATTPHARGPGGAAFFTDPGGRNWMAHHGWPRPGPVGYGNGGRRALFVEKVDFSIGRPRVNPAYPFTYHRDPPHPFVDVPGWAEPAVTWAWTEGIVTGYRDGPDRRLQSRAAVSRHDAVIQLRRAGPPQPVADLTRPTRPLTRGHAARLLYAAAGSPEVGGPEYDHPLTDVAGPAGLRDAVRWLLHDPDGPGEQTAIATGYSDLTFRPTDPVGRASFLQMLFHWLATPDP
jgi:hypothetical protein